MNMPTNVIRDLRKDEIKIRVQQVKEKHVVLLLYKDARCDMNILDEAFGIMGWKREHSRDNHNCTISVWDGSKAQWVSKEDTGTESFTEKEKGLASDSFKRSGVNWGIGRELSSQPSIKIYSGMCKIVKNNKGKFTTWDEFRVAKITYNRYGMIDGLAIKNQDNKVVFLQEPKDIEYLTTSEDIPPIQTPEETIVERSEQVIEHVDVSFPTEKPIEAPKKDVIIKEQRSLEDVVNRVKNKFVESPEVIAANEDGPGF